MQNKGLGKIKVIPRSRPKAKAEKLHFGPCDVWGSSQGATQIIPLGVEAVVPGGAGRDSEQLEEDRQREHGHSQPLPEPVSLAGVGVAADRVVLVRQPHNEDDVERGRGVIEELGHYGLHTWGQRGHQHVAGHGKGFPATSEQGCDCTCLGQ